MSDPVREQSLIASIGGSIQEMAKASAGFIADLVAQLVHGIQGVMIAPLALAFGCQAAASDAADKPAAKPEVAVVEPAPKADEGPKKLGLFNITFYYVTSEEEVARSKAKKKPAANDNGDTSTDADASNPADLAAVTMPEMTTIYAKQGCEPIAEVTREFAQQLKVQGTGKLRDGRVLNVWGHCGCETSPCFKVIEHQWGTGGYGRPLQPFRTVAVDPKHIKLGSLLYVPLLEGRTMPGRAPHGGFVHDGCVVADDTGGGIKGHQLDLFVGKKAWYLGVSGSRGSHSWARHVPVFDGAKICERKGRKVSKKSGGV